MKFRVIPTILTDGLTVVKGTQFNNWRTVGSAESAARLFAARDVDELIFLDVTARQRGTTISPKLIQKFSQLLTIPFSVGGGINSIEDARLCFRAGAEKVVLGTVAYRNPEIVSAIANEFGNQAVAVTVDLLKSNSTYFTIESGKVTVEENFLEYIENLESLGAGEIILQCVALDGEMEGLCLEKLSQATVRVGCPVIVSGGAGSISDFEMAFNAGATGVAAGSLFQFTELTPFEVSSGLKNLGVPVRNR